MVWAARVSLDGIWVNIQRQWTADRIGVLVSVGIPRHATVTMTFRLKDASDRLRLYNRSMMDTFMGLQLYTDHIRALA